MYNLPSRGHAKMLAADEILVGFGIESFRTRKGNYDYINMGDTYATTLLLKSYSPYSSTKNIFFVSTWGDIAEREGMEDYY